MKVITSPWAGGFLARRIIPAIFLIPILLGGIILYGQWQKMYSLDFGLAIFCLGTLILFLTFTWRIVRRLNRFDKAKDEAETALLHAHHELETQATKLEVSNQSLEAFSYSVSHDLRAPLRAIGGYSNLLLEDYSQQLDNSGNQMSHTVVHNAEKMGQLIDDLLRFSKVGSGGHPTSAFRDR